MFAGQYPAYAGSLSSLPSIGQMASQSSLQSSAAVPACSAQREAQLQRMAMVQQRRDAEKARRQSARQKLPSQPTILDSEQQAAAKYELSHSLWLAGRPDAARKWLGEILDKFPATQTADRARQTLAAL